MVLSLFLSLILLSPPSQTDPPPLAPNIDQLVGNLKQIQKDKADILAKEQAAIKSIQVEQKRINDLVNGAGIQPVPPPAPPDPFVASLQSAYDADKEADKATSLEFLQGTYAGLAADIKPGLATNAAGLAWIQAAISPPPRPDGTTIGLTKSQLSGVREAIAKELVSALGGGASAPLNQAQFASELNKIATSLKGVK